MRSTKSRRNNRRSRQTVAVASNTTQDGVTHRRHYASRTTGTYNGRSVIDAEKRAKRLERKQEAIAASKQEQQQEEKQQTETAAIPEVENTEKK